MIIKPTLFFELIEKHNPLIGWYRGKLIGSEPIVTSKGKPGICLNWQLSNNRRFKYITDQRFATDNLGLLSRMTWSWKNTKAGNMAKVGYQMIPDFESWIGDEADVSVGKYVNTGKTTVDMVLPPGSKVRIDDDGNYHIEYNDYERYLIKESELNEL